MISPGLLNTGRIKVNKPEKIGRCSDRSEGIAQFMSQHRKKFVLAAVYFAHFVLAPAAAKGRSRGADERDALHRTFQQRYIAQLRVNISHLG